MSEDSAPKTLEQICVDVCDHCGTLLHIGHKMHVHTMIVHIIYMCDLSGDRIYLNRVINNTRAL